MQVAMPIKKGDQDALKMIFEDESTPNAFLFTTGNDDEISAFKDGCKKSRGCVYIVQLTFILYCVCIMYVCMYVFEKSRECVTLILYQVNVCYMYMYICF